jgi:hypothetical protein
MIKLLLALFGFLFSFFATDTGGGAPTSEGGGKNTAPPPGGQPAAPSGEDKGKLADEARFTQADIDRMIKARLAEEETRTAKKTEADRKKTEEDALAKNAEWQTLAETRLTELTALKPQAERAAVLATRMNTVIDAQIADWPDEVRALDPGADAIEARLDWLEKARALAAKLAPAPKAPNMQLGSGQKPRTPATPPEGGQPAAPKAAYRFQSPNDVPWT